MIGGRFFQDADEGTHGAEKRNRVLNDGDAAALPGAVGRAGDGDFDGSKALQKVDLPLPKGFALDEKRGFIEPHPGGSSSSKQHG